MNQLISIWIYFIKDSISIFLSKERESKSWFMCSFENIFKKNLIYYNYMTLFWLTSINLKAY